MPDLIETARQALWACIDNYSELVDEDSETGRAFVRTLRGDNSDDGLILQRALDPALGEIPALAIKFAGLKSMWDTNQGQKWDMQFRFYQWTIDWHQPRATALVEKVIRSFWKYKTGNDVHIQIATGYYPREYGIDKLEFVTLGESGQTTRIEGFINLRSSKNPFVN